MKTRQLAWVLDKRGEKLGESDADDWVRGSALTVIAMMLAVFKEGMNMSKKTLND